jgi:hypothetical protein
VKPWLAFLILFAGTAAAQDPYKLEIDNQWVRVLRMKQAPHEKTPLLQHPATVIVSLTDSHQKFIAANGKATEVVRKAGEVSYLTSSTRAEENISDQPLEEIVVELKPASRNRPASRSTPSNLTPRIIP